MFDFLNDGIQFGEKNIHTVKKFYIIKNMTQKI